MGDNKVVAFMNMKGGVCKTTLCVNIAYTLSTQYNKKVLVIDVDPQFNATQYVLSTIYGKDFIDKYDELKAQGKTIFNLYNNMDKEDTFSEDIGELNALFNTTRQSNSYLTKDYISPIQDRLHFVMGDIRLVNLQIMNRTGNENVLKEYIEQSRLKEKYDYILIDSPPTYSTFFMSSYIACDTYVVPLKPDFMAALGLSLLNKGIEAIIKTGNIKKQCLGLVYTLIDTRNNVHIPICEELDKKYKGHIFKDSICYYSAVPKGINEGKFMLDINSYDIDKHIKSITEELMGRLDDVYGK